MKEYYEKFDELKNEYYFTCDGFGRNAPSNADEICTAANSLIDDMVDEYIQKFEAAIPVILEELIDELRFALNLLWEKYCMDDEINGVKSEWDDDENDDENDPSKVCGPYKFPWAYGPVHCPKTAINCKGCPYYSPDDDE